MPRDLETIVLKAMAKEPARRYATADEMAADLRRFLDDQPIAAGRAWVAGADVAVVRASAGTRRDCRRHFWFRWPAVFAESCGNGAGPNGRKTWRSFAAVSQSERERAERNLDEASRQRTIAEHEAERAEANYRTARQAVDKLLTMVSEDELRNQPGLQTLRLRLLTRALEYDQGMLAQRTNDPAGEAGIGSQLRPRRSHQEIDRIGRRSQSTDIKKPSASSRRYSPIPRTIDKRSLQLVGACNDLSLLQITEHDYAEAQRRLDQRGP